MDMEPGNLSIHETQSNHRIALAQPGQFEQVEGNWYVDAAAVDAVHLQLTDHEYVCPYKGRCWYVDFVEGDRRVSRVAWVYDDPKPGWEHIRGKYGFYAGAVAAKFGKTKDTLA